MYFGLHYSWCKSHLFPLYSVWWSMARLAVAYFSNDIVNGKIFEKEMYFTWDVDFYGLYNSYLKHLLSGKKTHRQGERQTWRSYQAIFATLLTRRLKRLIITRTSRELKWLIFIKMPPSKLDQAGTMLLICI